MDFRNIFSLQNNFERIHFFFNALYTFFPPKAAPIATKKLRPPSTGTQGGGQQGGSPPPGPPGGSPPPGCPSATKTNNISDNVKSIFM